MRLRKTVKKTPTLRRRIYSFVKLWFKYVTSPLKGLTGPLGLLADSLDMWQRWQHQITIVLT